MKNLSKFYYVTFLILNIITGYKTIAMQQQVGPVTDVWLNDYAEDNMDCCIVSSLIYGGLCSGLGGFFKGACLSCTSDERGDVGCYQCDCNYGWFPACDKQYYCEDLSQSGECSCCIAYSTSACCLAGGIAGAVSLGLMSYKIFKNYRENGNCAICN